MSLSIDQSLGIFYLFCAHDAWKVNLKTDGRKELVVEPTKRHEHKTNKKFQDFGRYSMTLIL